MPRKRNKLSGHGAILFLAGTGLGFVLGFHARFFSTIAPFFERRAETSMDDTPKQSSCKVCKEDQYWHVREPVQFLGPLSRDWLTQYDNCLPMPMRYKFSMNGTIGVSDRPPSPEGNPATAAGHSASAGQVYAPLASRKDLFGAKKDGSYIWSKELLQYLVGEVAAGKDISCKDYPQSATDVKYALELLGVGPDDSLLVGGSISPWVESIALHQGVGRVTTVDYAVPHCDSCHPRLETIHMSTLMRKSTPAGYSHIVSYSSIEHDGLGRYGDPLNPYGDLEAMKEFWSLLRVGGVLLLAIPLWEVDQLVQLLARLYGPIRLPWVIQGWEYLGCVNRGVWSTRVPLIQAGDYGWHPIIALRKTAQDQPATSTCTLDCTNSSIDEKKLLGYHACRPSQDCKDLSRHWPTLQKKYIRGQGQVDFMILNKTENMHPTAT